MAFILPIFLCAIALLKLRLNDLIANQNIDGLAIEDYFFLSENDDTGRFEL
jgi:hypothetical protein